ncbi:MAG: polyprenyl synthetase family protein, partial [Pseudomonadota bacterium]
QIADDLLDVTGTEEETGKRVGKDAGAGKATFVDILGIDGAKSRAAELVAQAEEQLSPYGDRAARLVDAAHFVVTRRN